MFRREAREGSEFELTAYARRARVQRGVYCAQEIHNHQQIFECCDIFGLKENERNMRVDFKKNKIKVQNAKVFVRKLCNGPFLSCAKHDENFNPVTLNVNK
jgi:hypothetical protein